MKCKNCGCLESEHPTWNSNFETCKQFIPSEDETDEEVAKNIIDFALKKSRENKGCGELFGKLQTTCIESQLCSSCKLKGCGKPTTKSELGKKSRDAGMRFERKVRADLESKGWIVDKWTNNVDLELSRCGKFSDFKFT